MNDLSQLLAIGTLLVIETGKYSDRDWCGPVRVKREFVKAEAASSFKSQWKPTFKWDEEGRPPASDFLPWLIKEGYVEDVENVTSWHVGSYGDFEP